LRALWPDPEADDATDLLALDAPVLLRRREGVREACGSPEGGRMSALPAPLPVIPVDFPIVLEITDGDADTRLAHLPAPLRMVTGTRGGCQLQWDDYDYPPARWRSACGLVDGWVYNRGGVLAGVPVCLACEDEVA